MKKQRKYIQKAIQREQIRTENYFDLKRVSQNEGLDHSMPYSIKYVTKKTAGTIEDLQILNQHLNTAAAELYSASEYAHRANTPNGQAWRTQIWNLQEQVNNFIRTNINPIMSNYRMQQRKQQQGMQQNPIPRPFQPAPNAGPRDGPRA